MTMRIFPFAMISPLGRISVRRYASLYTRILKRKTKRGTTDKTSRENVLHLDISDVLATRRLTLDDVKIPEKVIVNFLFAGSNEDVKVDNVSIIAVTSEGEGLGLIPRHNCEEPALIVVKVPKTVVGDVVSIILRRHHDYYAEGELVSVSRKGRKQSKRNDRMVICKHFSKCDGCQLQMLSYEDQLEFKRLMISRAYRYFYPDLNTSEIEFGNVVGSPMQFAYRTKITPHAAISRGLKPLDLPIPLGFDSVLPKRPVVDIDSCPIAVPSINSMLPVFRQEFQKAAAEYVRTLPPKKIESNFILRDSIRIDHDTGEYENVCLTKRNNVVTEQVGEFVFQFEANEFFQNNRSILPSFLDFIRHNLRQAGRFNYIVDTYCGSGFLGIALSNTLPESGKVFGIEIAKKAINYAHHNAKINGLYVPDKIQFVEGDSQTMFLNKEFLEMNLKGEDCVLLMNPSRKGSTKEFLSRVMEFRPKVIVYVSCNVFTQARDLAMLKELQSRIPTKYRVKSVTGFDFYPQTKHVESVAILELI